MPVLIKNVQTLFVNALESHLTSMLNTADDRLFDMAENSHNNAQFDAMRLLRVKREGLMAGFVKELNNNFHNVLANKSNDSLSENLEETSIENIALVKDDDLEEDIATDSMAKKAQQSNQDALENIRIRLDTFSSDRSIDQENNPFEPIHICNAFRLSTQQLDIDIASMLVIYKLFERSVMSELDVAYDLVNNFFIEKGILPDLKIKRIKPKKNNAKPINHIDPIEQLPINEQSGRESSFNQSVEILSVIQNLLAQSRSTSLVAQQATSVNSNSPGSNIPVNESMDVHIPQFDDSLVNESKIDTLKLVQALSNIQSLPFSSSHLNQNVLSSPDLRTSINHQLPVLNNTHPQSAQLGQFNEDMIDIVSMLFDFILDDENLQAEIKSVLGRLQIPMLKVALIDKTFLSNRRHSARMLLNELAHAGLAWDKNDKTAEPMLEKIINIAGRIIEEFEDEVNLFEELLTDFRAFKKQFQQRATIFERRTKEAEEGKAKTESSRVAVNNRLAAICNNQNIPNVVKLIFKKVWSHVMLLERLKDNKEAWQNRVKVAKLLVWSVQPLDTVMQIEKMTSRVPLLVKSLRKGMNIISFSEIEASYLFDELEECHRNIIDIAREKINAEALIQDEEEEILRLPALDLEREKIKSVNSKIMGEQNTVIDGSDFNEKYSDKLDSLKFNDYSSQEVAIENTVIKDVIIDEIGFTSAQTGAILKESVEKIVTINARTIQTIEQLRAGNWLELKIEEQFVRCKLVAKIASSGKHIFVNRNGVKVAELLTQELCQNLQLGKLKIFDDEALFDRALESVISNLRSMKAQA